MKLIQLNPNELKPNNWNSNHLTPEAELKLENSLTRFNGLFKPILVRELSTGEYEILGGAHRAAAAERLGIESVPVLNLGHVDDQKAKEISLIDNGRYGHDDAAQLSRLLAELGTPQDIASFMPFDLAELDTITSVAALDLDKLDLDVDDTTDDTLEAKPARAPKTNVIMRFKIPIEDQAHLETVFKRIIADQELVDSDSLVNAGDALVWLIRRWTELDTE